MCLICIEFEKEKLTINEAKRNLTEMRDKLDVYHHREVENMLFEAEMEEFNEQLRAMIEGDYEELDAFDFDNLQIGFGD